MSYNPYTTPTANLGAPDTRNTDTYPGIQRFIYFLLSIVVALLTNLFSVAARDGVENLGKNIATFSGVAVFLVALPISLWICSLRLKNIGWNGWWCLLQLVPIANLIQGIYLLSAPTGYAQFKQYDTAGKVVAGICIAMILLGLFGFASLWMIRR